MMQMVVFLVMHIQTVTAMMMASGATVKNSSVNFSRADWQPLGGSWTDEFGTGSNIVEIIDNSDNSNDVDLTR